MECNKPGRKGVKHVNVTKAMILEMVERTMNEIQKKGRPTILQFSCVTDGSDAEYVGIDRHVDTAAIQIIEPHVLPLLTLMPVHAFVIANEEKTPKFLQMLEEKIKADVLSIMDVMFDRLDKGDFPDRMTMEIPSVKSCNCEKHKK